MKDQRIRVTFMVQVGSEKTNRNSNLHSRFQRLLFLTGAAFTVSIVFLTTYGVVVCLSNIRP